MAKDISDRKSLKLKELGHATIRMLKLPRGSCPQWTESLEKTLAALPSGDLEHLSFLFDVMLVGINKGELPK